MVVTEKKALNGEQIEELERFIAKSPDAGFFARKAMIWMLQKSEGMTKVVCLSFNPSQHTLAKLVADGIHNMRSAQGITYITKFMRNLGAPMTFSFTAGHYTGREDDYDPRSEGFTVWIAEEGSKVPIERLEVDLNEIWEVELPS